MTDLLWFFWIYSFGGYLVERAFAAATRAERRERKCFLLLPLCPVYGLGMLAVLALPESWRQGPWLIAAGAAAAPAVEYAVPWAYATFRGVHSRLGDLLLCAAVLRGRGVLRPVFVGDPRCGGTAGHRVEHLEGQAGLLRQPQVQIPVNLLPAHLVEDLMAQFRIEPDGHIPGPGLLKLR